MVRYSIAELRILEVCTYNIHCVGGCGMASCFMRYFVSQVSRWKLVQ